MRILVLLSGTPASGKSTFVKEHGLEQYTISPDEIRLLHQSPVLTINGEEEISQTNDNKVWKLVQELIEKRMERGEFTVVDATHTKKEDIAKYKPLINKYKYRMYVVDFSDIPLEVALERNAKRGYKKVPENVIVYMHERLQNLIVPSYATKIKPEEFEIVIKNRVLDFNEYEKIHHIGDIHGCNTVLQKYIGEMKDDELYIFMGDFTDRGIENKEVLEFLFSIMYKRNVIFMEGNHEIHVWKYATNEFVRSREFKEWTQEQIKFLDKKNMRELYRKCNQAIIYNYGEKTILVNHGGISNFPEKMAFIATDQLIRGVGKYEDCDKVAESFTKLTNENIYQIHGHRRNPESSIQTGRVFNLCDGVENGEYLRVVTLDKNGFECIKIKNNVFREKNIPVKRNDATVDEIIRQFDQNLHLINRLENPDNIVSYAFSTRVFKNQIWNDLTTKARGFFIHKDTHEIISRSYEKFFNIEEVHETTLDYMKGSLEFPLKCYVKENGFLGMIGYNSVNDKLVFSSKSKIDGKYADYFRAIFDQYVDDHEYIKEYLKKENCSAIFEVIDPINDPHIIKYEKPTIILLDLVKRTVKFEKKPYEEVVNFAKKIGVEVKGLAFTIDCWEDFVKWHETVNQKDWTYKGKYIEGFVVEDVNGFMFKEKLYYYKFWKHLRGMKDKLRSYKIGKCQRVPTGSLLNNDAINFYGWMNGLSAGELEQDIISLREAFTA